MCCDMREGDCSDVVSGWWVVGGRWVVGVVVVAG